MATSKSDGMRRIWDLLERVKRGENITEMDLPAEAERFRAKMYETLADPPAVAVKADGQTTMMAFLSSSQAYGADLRNSIGDVVAMFAAMTLHAEGELTVGSVLTPVKWGSRQTLTVSRGGVELGILEIIHPQSIPAGVTSLDGTEPIVSGMTLQVNPVWLDQLRKKFPEAKSPSN